MRIFSFILPVRVSGLLFSEFLLIFICYLAALSAGFKSETVVYLRDDLGLVRLLLVSASALLGIFLNNLYADTRVDSRVMLVLKICNVIGIALIVQGVLAYVTSGLSLPRSVMLAGSVLAFLTLVVWRIFYSNVLLRMIGTQRVLFVGKNLLVEQIASRMLMHPELGFGVCGHLANATEGASASHTSIGDFLGSREDLAEVAEKVKPDRIVIGMPDQRSSGLPAKTLLGMVRSGVLIEDAASTYETICGRVSLRDLRASQIIFRNELASRPGSVALQSIYTNLAAIISVVMALPLMFLCALAVKLTSRGPLLEADLRVGQHGIPFNLNRFRCHRLAAEGTHQSLEDRLTPVGKWLQKLHLVRLPQVFNLLRGEITLVGPRAEKPEFVEELSKHFAYYRQRHSVKPGITGWSQINFKSPDDCIDPIAQLEYDLYYTKHISLALDAYILLHGVRQLLPFTQR